MLSIFVSSMVSVLGLFFLPTITRSTLGVSMSRLPNPYPIFSITNSGSLPNSLQRAFRIAAPVGVVSSFFAFLL